MKIKSIFTVAVFSFASVVFLTPSASASLTCAQGGTCVVGDTGPGGGKVFFVKSTGSFTKSRTVNNGMFNQTYTAALTSAEQAALPFDYLEVAPTQSASSLNFGTNGLITGGTSELIGTGESNTAKIIATLTSDTASNNAAYFADAYTNNSKTDWFLPSYDELLLIMILSLESDSGGPSVGSFPDGLWASTTNDITTAKYSARNQLSGDVTKGAPQKVRAIRSFSAAPAGNNSNTDSEAEIQRKRQAAIDNARAVILKKVIAKESLSIAELQAAEEPSLSTGLLTELNKKLLLLDRTSEIQYAFVAFQIAKCKAYDQIAGNLSGKVYPRNLITYGIISKDYPMKSLAFSRLMNLPVVDRDSIKEIDAFLADEAARNASLKAKVQARASAKR